ncbi:OprO/OprP family phosphate-selective porin [Aquimonas voraii]|uniref:Phosphate-selective porin OprO and OprP n=1 Tax=Aquimonas voraii TaxID=265719 RepID=A0A1G6W652_9GAMM|nr:porin [Aquimonas voraii]SDD61319.1 phosphate-selective porin OprO and OprP [Aquimonas voraii]
MKTVLSLLGLALGAGLGASAAQAQALPQGWTLTPTLSANYDWLRVDEDARAFPDVRDFRRARIGITIKSGERWQLRGEHDVEERTAPELSFQWFLGGGRHLRFGQFKHPFLLDDVINERQTPLMEQSLTAAYAVSRRLGVAYGQSNERHSFDLSLFDKRLDGRFEGSGLATRYTRVLSRSGEGLLHVGGSLAIDSPRSDSARWNVRPESGIASRSLVDTGTFADVDQNQRFAAEALWLHGPWSLQAEHAIGRSTRSQAGDFSSNASYALISWSPSGHARSYKSGVVGSPKAGEGEMPWELFLRFSRIDLDDAPVLGGTQRDWTLGATWYVHPNVRLLANYTAVRSARRGVADDPNLLQFRIQLSY